MIRRDRAYMGRAVSFSKGRRHVLRTGLGDPAAAHSAASAKLTPRVQTVPDAAAPYRRQGARLCPKSLLSASLAAGSGTKILGLGLSLVLCGLISCERNPVEEYGKDITRAYKGAQKVEERTSIQNLQESIKAFHASNGRYPNDLKELSDFTGLTLDENRYAYNPSDGTIRHKK